MPVNGRPTWTKKFMCLLRVMLIVIFLCAVDYGSVTYAEIKRKGTKPLNSVENFQVVYTALYDFNWQALAVNAANIVLLLMAVFVRCPCTFFGSSEYLEPTALATVLGVRYLMLPFLAKFIFCWLITTSHVCIEIFLICGYQTDLRIEVHRDLIVFMLFKILIGCNTLLLTMRGLCLFAHFDENPEHAVDSEYDFGDYLNLIFRV